MPDTPLPPQQTHPMTDAAPDMARDAGPGATPAAAPLHGLADDLQRLREAANGVPITVDALLKALADRGHAVIILLLTAPFVFIPIPGLSTVVGLAVMGLSLGVLLNTGAWVPKFIRRRELTPETLERLINGTNRTLGKLSRFVKPRMQWMTGRSWHWLAGISLFAANIAFALPGPPGNNIPPALAMSLLALGLLERDGLILIVGHILTWVTWAAIIILLVFFWDLVDGYVQEFAGKFSRLLG